MKVNVKKLYRGMVELRDYQIKSCKKRNENIIVTLNGKNPMTIKVEQFKDGIKTLEQQSKFSNTTYWLVAFRYKPDFDKKQAIGQVELLGGDKN